MENIRTLVRDKGNKSIKVPLRGGGGGGIQAKLQNFTVSRHISLQYAVVEKEQREGIK